MEQKTINLFSDMLKILKPSPDLTIGEWADKYRILSKENSSEPGQWDTNRTPYMKEIYNCLVDSHTESVTMMCSAQVGKALAVGTPIPTLEGWKNIEELKIGDYIFGNDGKLTKVIFKTPITKNRKMYKLTFTDGSVIEACEEHKWCVDISSWGRITEKDIILKTKDMLADYKSIDNRNKSRYKYIINNAAPLRLPEISLPISPYILGVWLGDGNSYSAQLSLNAEDYKEILNNFEIEYEVRNEWNNKVNCVNVKLIAFHKLLSRNNLIKNKHIPNIYKRASVNQRLELLQGLMDTDGHIKKNGGCEISLSNQRLADDVYELLMTLGVKVGIKKRKAKLYGIEKKDKYVLTFTPYKELFNPFKLARKRKYVKNINLTTKRHEETLRRRIINIEEIENKGMVCISVDNKDKLFLAGKQMIPTHNTEMLLNILGRYMHLDPCPMLFVQPTVEDAKGFSKERVEPMIRDTKVLKRLVKKSNKRAEGTVQGKMFPGGYVRFVGANSPSGLASRPIRITLLDEVDRFPGSAKEEGNPVELAEARTTTFFNRKMLRVSTPTDDTTSKIKKLFLQGSQEEWCLPCPHCGELQAPKWEYIHDDEGIIKMECQHCGSLEKEELWKKNNQAGGRWIARFPEEKKNRSFHMNALASPWKSWAELYEQYLNVKDDEFRMRTFTNTVLGETFVLHLDEQLDFEALFERREEYGAELHDNIRFLTAGVDVQDNRLEILVVGWGYGYESYVVQYRDFPGSPGKEDVWIRLDEFLKKKFSYKNKKSIPIACTLIDSGGHHTGNVYKYVHGKSNRNIFAIKGQGGFGVNILNGFRKTTKKGVPSINLLSLGVNALKDLTYSRLTILEGPGTCHFPADSTKGCGMAFFEGITAEVKVKTMTAKGEKIEWQVLPGRRNEPLDLMNYATAGMELLGIDLNNKKYQKGDK